MILIKTFQFLLVMILIAGQEFFAQVINDGIDLSIGNLYMLSDAKTKSISPENFTGDKGKGGTAALEENALPNTANAAAAAAELGQGWEVNPENILG